MTDKMKDRLQTQIERITCNEERLDHCSAAVQALGEALTLYSAVQNEFRELEAYYGSREWFADKEAQENGAFPATLKCGVLSEDAVYDLLAENKDSCVKMAEILAALKE